MATAVAAGEVSVAGFDCVELVRVELPIEITGPTSTGEPEPLVALRIACGFWQLAKLTGSSRSGVPGTAPLGSCGREARIVLPGPAQEAERQPRQHQPAVAAVLNVAAPRRGVQVLHRPAAGRQGPRRHRALPELAGQHRGGLRRREVPVPSPGTDPADLGRCGRASPRGRQTNTPGTGSPARHLRQLRPMPAPKRTRHLLRNPRTASYS